MKRVGVGRGAGAGGGGLSRRKDQHMQSWQEQALRANGRRQTGRDGNAEKGAEWMRRAVSEVGCLSHLTAVGSAFKQSVGGVCGGGWSGGRETS